MYKKLIILGVAGVLFSGQLFAEESKHHSMTHMKKKVNSHESISTKEYKSGMDKMHEEMMIEYSGDADIDFARGMIPHHKGAVDMAETLLKHGKDPELKKMAQEIIDAQKAEIKFLEEWLNKNDKPKISTH